MARTTLYPQIAETLRCAREARGLMSQEAAAHDLDVSLTTYGRWERGERQPQGRLAQRIHERWKVPLDSLRVQLEPEDRPPSPSVGAALSEIHAAVERVEKAVLLLAAAQGVDVADAGAHEHVAELLTVWREVTTGPSTRLLGDELAAAARARRSGRRGAAGRS